ncbi:MAG: arsenic transporter [Xanthobacteraceae bacterium]
MSSHLAIWVIAALAVAGVLIRPFATIEAVWAVGGAALLVVLRLITPSTALAGIAKGTDVYLFLTGMMLLAEVARCEGLFDWLAALATQHANGSPRRLFLLIYIVGTAVTVFLSNDATAVVLTPAVAAAVRTAKAEQPLPYLLICAFVANAASFVLPISNPANLVIYGSHMPPLLQWLPRYVLPSAVSIVATYALLRWTQRSALRQSIAAGVPLPKLATGGKIVAAGIAATAIVLLTASAMDMQLGLPTCIAGVATAAIVLLFQPAKTWSVVKDISWSVLPLVAGLFVLVEALNETGLVASISALLRETAAHSVAGAAWAAGIAVAFGSNLANNLPVGLIGGSVLQNDHIADKITRAILIGVDLGPNLSVTGSLATILWLGALRRERVNIGAGSFLKWGAIVMPPALVFAIAAALL